MRLNNEDLLRLRNLKQEVLEIPEWGGEVVVRELSISEAATYRQMINENKPLSDVIKYACSCTMVEPTMSIDEDLTNVSQSYAEGLERIFNNIPLIGKNKEEREEFLKKQAEISKTPKSELTKEEEEKK